MTEVRPESVRPLIPGASPQFLCINSATCQDSIIELDSENQAAEQVTRAVSRIKGTTSRPAYSLEMNSREYQGQGVSLLVISLYLRARSRKQTKTELTGKRKEGVRTKTKEQHKKKMKTP